MGKKAQQKRAVKHAKQAKQRKAAASRNAAMSTAAAQQPPLDDGFAPSPVPWGDYATVADALTAAEDAGGVLSCFVSDDLNVYELSLRRGEDGWRYEVALYPDQVLRDLVKTSWLDADDQDQAVKQLHLALAAYIPQNLRQPGLETVQRPSTTSMPRIGWAQSLPMAGMQTWEDVVLAEKELPLFELAPLADGPDDMHWGRPEDTLALFREHGLSPRACVGCRAPVTDRHPHWPGVLVSMDNEYGPACGRFYLAGKSPQKVGHILDATQALTAGNLTGKEQTTQCQNCDAHITDQHPDWPGVWTKASGSNSPICAIVGGGGDDATSYDLIDCVYPHHPVGADSPAATAITTAKKTGYFSQPRWPGLTMPWA